MTREEREAKTKKIIRSFVLLGICEPETEEERQEVEARRQKIGAERFDSSAKEAAATVARIFQELDNNDKALDKNSI